MVGVRPFAPHNFIGIVTAAGQGDAPGGGHGNLGQPDGIVFCLLRSQGTAVVGFSVGIRDHAHIHAVHDQPRGDALGDVHARRFHVRAAGRGKRVRQLPNQRRVPSRGFAGKGHHLRIPGVQAQNILRNVLFAHFGDIIAEGLGPVHFPDGHGQPFPRRQLQMHRIPGERIGQVDLDIPGGSA